MMALKFYELGRLSLGQAAELAGHTKRAFIDVLARYGIPVVDYPASELANETWAKECGAKEWVDYPASKLAYETAW